MGSNNKSAVSGWLVMTVLFVFIVRIAVTIIEMVMGGSPTETIETVTLIYRASTIFSLLILAVWFLLVRLYSVRITHHSSMDFSTAFALFTSGFQSVVTLIYAIFYFRFANEKVNITDLELGTWIHSITEFLLWGSICSLYMSIYLYRKAISNNSKIRGNIYFLYFVMLLETAAIIYSIKGAFQVEAFECCSLPVELISWMLFCLFMFNYMKKDFKLREHRHHHHSSRSKYSYLRAAEPKAEVNPNLGKYESHSDYVRMEVEDVEPKMNPNLGTYEPHRHHHHHHNNK